MSYVVAFDRDGTARDVTQRYAKAFSAKRGDCGLNPRDVAASGGLPR